MIKVLHLFKEYLSVSESWAYNLLRSLKDVDVTIGAVYYTPDKTYKKNDFSFIKHPYSDLLYHYFQSGKLSFLQRLKIQIQRKFKKIELDEIGQWINVHQPELIHIHFGTTAVYYKDLLNNSKTSFVVSFYGYDYTQAPQNDPKLAKQYKWIFQTAEKIIEKVQMEKVS